MTADVWLGVLVVLSIGIGGSGELFALLPARLVEHQGGASNFSNISRDGVCISRADVAAELQRHLKSKASEQDVSGQGHLPGADSFVKLAEIFSESVVYEQADADHNACINRSEFGSIQQMDSDVEVEGLRGAVDEVLFKTTWPDIDAKGGGLLTFGQFSAAMKVPIFVSQAVFNFADANTDGLLSHAELVMTRRFHRESLLVAAPADVASFVKTHWEAFEQAESRREFLTLDADGNHVITRSEAGRHMRAIQVETMFRFADADKNDLLSLDEFSAVGIQQAVDDALSFLLRPLGPIPLLPRAFPLGFPSRQTSNPLAQHDVGYAKDLQTDALQQERPIGVQDSPSPVQRPSLHSSFHDRLKHIREAREQPADNSLVASSGANRSSLTFVSPRKEHVHLVRRHLRTRPGKQQQQHEEKFARPLLGSSPALKQPPQPAHMSQPPPSPSPPQTMQHSQHSQLPQQTQQHRRGQLGVRRLPWLWRRQVGQPPDRSRWTQQRVKAGARNRRARAFELVLGRRAGLAALDAPDAHGLPRLFARRKHTREVPA